MTGQGLNLSLVDARSFVEKVRYSGDLKKDAKWYISNMKRYLPGIKKDMDYSQGTW